MKPIKQICALALLAISTPMFSQISSSIPVEGHVGYLDFSNNSNLKDTWYAGVASGVNFTENAGLRAYYWKALEDNNPLKTDNLEVYGAETIVKAPITKTIKPYIVAGGGVLKPYGDYKDKNGATGTVEDKFYGTAGVGLDLSFINFVSARAYGRAMISEFDQLNTVADKGNKIDASYNYGVSLNFDIGGKKKTARKQEVIYPSTEVSEEVKSELTTPVKEVVTEKKDVIEPTNEYQQQINSLKLELEGLKEQQKKQLEKEQLRKEVIKELYMEKMLLNDSSNEQQHKIQVINLNGKELSKDSSIEVPIISCMDEFLIEDEKKEQNK